MWPVELPKFKILNESDKGVSVGVHDVLWLTDCPECGARFHEQLPFKCLRCNTVFLREGDVSQLMDGFRWANRFRGDVIRLAHEILLLAAELGAKAKDLVTRDARYDNVSEAEWEMLLEMDTGARQRWLFKWCHGREM